MTTREEKIVVIGGGLVGGLCALALAQLGYRVTLVERSESVASSQTVKRSINLALSLRGQAALNRVGLLDEVMKLVIPMHCRAIHIDGNLKFQPYDEIDANNHINSVSRQYLNELLVDKASEHVNVEVLYGWKLINIDKSNVLHFETAADPGTFNDMKPGSFQIDDADLIIGCDGAYSTVRESMLRLQATDFSRRYISHAYKELEIRPTASGDFQLPNPEALHIWPCGEFMMIALPNLDRSFTCTIFAPVEKLLELETDAQALASFFDKHFPDVTPLMPDYVEQFKVNPTCRLLTSKVDPWNFDSKMVIMGDAAHAMVPFYGQGMNCGFEDVLELLDTLKECDYYLPKAIPTFAKARKVDADAIIELSLKNYIEMRSHTASSAFLVRKKIEGMLNWMLPNTWIPLYKMVAFTRMPYHQAIIREERQSRILGFILNSVTTISIGCGLYFLYQKNK